MNYFISLILSFGLAAWLTRRFCNPGSRFHVLDHPNERSLHLRPVPRSGGLAILAGIVAGMSFVAWRFNCEDGFYWLSPSIIMVAIVSYIDDHRHVSVIIRLLVQLLAASLVLWGGYSVRLFEVPGLGFAVSHELGALLSVLFIVWMINLYNFMDGMDGFAGGMAVIGFSAFALLGWWSGNAIFTLLNLVVAAAAGGFLLFNFPPARIFMGDVGSSTLGLLAAVFSLWGSRDGVFPFWIAILIFSPFVFDASATLIRRLLKRENILRAHKTHYYQKLVQAGWGHRKTVFMEYIIMGGCGLTALLSVKASVHYQVLTLAAWVVFYFFFFMWVSWYTSRRHSAST